MGQFIVKNFILYPIVFYIFYIFFIGVLLVRSRIKAVSSKQVSIKFFKTYSGQELNEQLTVLGRHFDNQFQIPVLFLFGCFALYMTDRVTSHSLIFAWLFVISRLVHSWIHLTLNNVLHRMIVFIFGFLMTLIVWAFLIIN